MSETGSLRMDRLDIHCRGSVKHLILLMIVHGLSLYSLAVSGQIIFMQTVVSIFVVISFIHFGRLVQREFFVMMNIGKNTL